MQHQEDKSPVGAKDSIVGARLFKFGIAWIDCVIITQGWKGGGDGYR